MTEPRYSKKHQEQAKDSKGCMFTLNLNRKYTECENAGGSTTVQGVARPEIYPYLHLAMMLCNGLSLEDAKAHVGL